MRTRALFLGLLGVASVLYVAATDFGWQMALGAAAVLTGCAIEDERVYRSATAKAGVMHYVWRPRLPAPRTGAIAIAVLTAAFCLFYTSYRLGYAAGYHQSEDWS